MAFMQQFRNKARKAVDSVFCSSSPDVLLVGGPDSGWHIKDGLPLTSVYCAGVGLGISFEVELAKRSTRPILVLDPSPTGIATAERGLPPNLEFLAVGMAAESRSYEFSMPRDPGEGSYSVPQQGLPLVRFECWSLATIMGRFADTSVDLLKMDIEGFEFNIIGRILDDGIAVRQICVEFHPWLGRGRTLRTIFRLYAAGYRIIHKRRGDYTFLLDEERFNDRAAEFRRRASLSS